MAVPARPSLLLLAALAAAACTGTRPERLSLAKVPRAPCPETPNCVASYTPADDEVHAIAPLPLTGPPAEALAKLKRIVTSLARAKVVREEPGYLHAEFTSQLFRFVDDVEFFVDEGAGVVHFRSASRLGRGDSGVNRRRMEEIRALFTTGR